MSVVAQRSQQFEVVAVSMEMVDAVDRRFPGRGARRVLEIPPVVVDGAAFNLVRGGGRAPQEVGWELGGFAAVQRAPRRTSVIGPRWRSGPGGSARRR